MKTGEVYLFNNTAGYVNSIKIHFKVISFDHFEVLFDSKKTDDNEWPFDSKKVKTVIFNRASSINYDSSATELSYEPYSPEKAYMLRPDLPLRFGRIRELSWGDAIFSTEESISIFLHKSTNKEIIISSSQVYLIGIAKSGSPKKSTLFNARNGHHFTVAELLFQANKIQTDIYAKRQYKSKGIGVYRCGIKNGIPSYFIWEFYDLANNLKDYEEMGIDIEYA